MEGWTLAVDFPLDKFDFDEVDNFINKLIQYNGKIYLAKDSILKAKTFKISFLAISALNFVSWFLFIPE